VDFIKSHPGRSFLLATVRILDLWNPVPHTSTEYSLRKKLVSGVPYLVFLALALPGFFAIRKEPFLWIVLAILAMNTAANGIIAVSVRYRVIFDVILLLAATHFLLEFARKKFDLDKLTAPRPHFDESPEFRDSRNSFQK
jgi:hypothetical protein